MKKFLLAALIAGSVASASSASAQSSILLETYGRGVHAYFSHQNAEAQQYLTDAINNGLQDPRAYYFRGIAAAEAGDQIQAEADWATGAELEAQGRIIGAIGPALTRVQGPQRLRMEEVRRETTLRVLALAASRAEARFGEINDAGGEVLRPIPSRSALPPAPPAAARTTDPFSGDAAGDASLDSRDSLEGAMEDPFADDILAPVEGGQPAADGQPGALDVFSDDAPAADAFGDPPAGGDPFGADPFGGDPFN